MKTYIKIIFTLFLAVTLAGCDKDDDFLDLEGLDAPDNLGATFEITQDNTGLVTIIPTGEGASLFQIDFGDGSPVSQEIRVGERVEHVYAEGQYNVVITGKNINGKTAKATQPLTVSFLAPENLVVNITRDPNDNYTINVSATAQNAAMYHVYFGEVSNEDPTPLMAGGSVSYTYSSIGTYDVRVVALSGGAATTEVITPVMISDPLFLPINFESATLNYSFENFGGGEGAGAPVINNPDPSGVNTSARVASYTKVAGSEIWAGTTIALDEPIDFSTNRYIAVDVWSPIAGARVLFKIENLGDPNINVESFATTTVSNQWETLVFDLNGIDSTKEYGRIALFFNFGISGTGETYYVDNIRTTRLELIKLPLTFESATVNYNWGGFGGAGGAVITNPDKSGINTSDKVTALTKSTGSEIWAGISLNLDEAINFSEGTTIRMKVWSPKTGAPILFKFEDSNSPPDNNGNPSVVVEVFQNTTTSNAWEEMSFDLTSFQAFNPAASYDRVVIFYDFGTSGTGSTFYFDDIRLTSGGGTTGGKTSFPINFETPATGGTSEWKVFESETPPLQVINNPNPSGINTSSRVAKFTAPFPGANYAGTNTVLEQPFTLSASNSIVKIMIWKSVISDVGIKFEADFASTGEIKVPNTKINEWEELTFDFSGKIGEASSVNINGIVVFPDFDNRSQTNIVYFDNITLSASTGGGPSGSTAPTTAAPTPSVASANVISMFSDAYTNVAVDTWRTDWSNASLEDLTIAGSAVKKYSNLNFVGVETVSSQINASAMTHFHVDIWTGNLNEIKIKLVDFGPNGSFQGGDDKEHEITIANFAKNQWVSIDVPLTQFTGLTTRSNIAQLIFSGVPGGGSVFIDNVYFHN